MIIFHKLAEFYIALQLKSFEKYCIILRLLVFIVNLCIVTVYFVCVSSVPASDPAAWVFLPPFYRWGDWAQQDKEFPQATELAHLACLILETMFVPM